MRVTAAEKAVAIVGVGALMPDASSAPKFWQNIREGRYSITDVDRERWDPNLYFDPIRKLQISRIRRSGAGYAIGNGIL